MNRMRAPLLALMLALAPGAAYAQSAPVVVGAAVSQTGQLADLAAGYRKGLLLWQDHVNAGGGLLGRRVELRLLDDRSEASTAGQLYARLLRDHGADLLIGPFGSAASRGAAAAAERAHRILINATGAARSVLRAGDRFVFQLAAPYARYGTSVLGLARRAGYRRLFILARDDPASQQMAEGAAAHAARQALTAGGGAQAGGTGGQGRGMEMSERRPQSLGVEGDGGDVGARRHERLDDRGADAPARSGDDDGTSVEADRLRH